MVRDDTDPTALLRLKDGRAWQIGSAADVAWIEQATELDSGICCAIPPTFAAYCTVAQPKGGPGVRLAHDRAVIALLQACSRLQPWWLGYLENGIGIDVVFYDAPRVKLYGDDYVVVKAGPEQALSWRDSEGRNAPPKGALPDFIFPADHSWLLSTLWDDFWSCIGGPEALIARVARDPLLAPLTRVVARGAQREPYDYRL
jgi:hypothetical protein